MRKDVTILSQNVLPFDFIPSGIWAFLVLCGYRVVHLCLFLIAPDLVIPIEEQYAINHRQQMRTGGIISTRYGKQVNRTNTKVEEGYQQRRSEIETR